VIYINHSGTLHPWNSLHKSLFRLKQVFLDSLNQTRSLIDAKINATPEKSFSAAKH